MNHVCFNTVNSLYFKSLYKLLKYSPLLLCSVLVSSYVHASPYAIEHVIAEQGSAKEEELEQENVETLSVYGSRRILLIDNTFTSDNILVFPEQTVGLSRTVADVITQTVGVELNGQGGLLQSYNMRGFSRDRIKTEVNGIPIITDRRAGNSVSFIPTVLINNVTIQKGPSASLYGAGAMGGVIGVSTIGDENSLGFTLQPNDENNGLASQQIQAQYSNKHGNIGGVYRQADNSYSANNTLLNSKFEQAAVTASTSFMWQNLDVNASVIYSDGSNIGKSSNAFLVSRNSLYPQDKHVLSQIQLSNNDVWTLQLFQHKQAWQSDVTRLTKTVPARRNLTDYSSHTLGALATYALENTKLGFEWHTRKNINISEQEFDADNQLLWQHQSVNANENKLGMYVNQLWYVDNLIFNAGVRYDYISLKKKVNDESFDQKPSVNKEAFSASLSAQYNVTAQTYINVEVASSFRFPTVSELLFSGETPRGNTQGNPELLSEKSKGYQLSLHHQFSSSIKGQINTYLYNVKDYIERVTLDSGSQNYRPYQSYQNIDSVKINGIELLAFWQPSAQFNSSLGLQWQQGKNKKNETVDDGLPTSIKWAWQWTPNMTSLPNFLLTSNVIYRFEKDQFGPSEVLLDKALLWNTALQFNLSKQSQVRLSVVNLMNENYQASSDEDAPFQPKRSWNLAFTWFY